MSECLIRSRNRKAVLLLRCLSSVLQNGIAYVQVFVGILRDISKQDTVEYVLALLDDMLSGMSELVSGGFQSTAELIGYLMA